ncbi:unnamed protein product [Urochloa decumbens]|uniref:SKP1-like protein n=1 Tax=Urochloa decumbens TaxID=240449 RepID=A0ABC9ECX2_9POAL
MAGDNDGATMITLVSSDDVRFEVPEAAATLSQTVRRLIEEGGGHAAGSAGIPLPNVDALILSKVIEYCNKHAPAPDAGAAAAAAVGKQDLESFDREFINVDTSTLCSLIMAADYLKVTGLAELAGQAIADLIKGKTPEEIKKAFRITDSGFTAEEEEEIRRENAWAYE